MHHGNLYCEMNIGRVLRKGSLGRRKVRWKDDINLGCRKTRCGMTSTTLYCEHVMSFYESGNENSRPFEAENLSFKQIEN